jgi:hypothetical protein
MNRKGFTCTISDVYSQDAPLCFPFPQNANGLEETKVLAKYTYSKIYLTDENTFSLRA